MYLTGSVDHIISYHTIKTADVDYDDIINIIISIPGRSVSISASSSAIITEYLLTLFCGGREK